MIKFFCKILALIILISIAIPLVGILLNKSPKIASRVDTVANMALNKFDALILEINESIEKKKNKIEVEPISEQGNGELNHTSQTTAKKLAQEMKDLFKKGEVENEMDLLKNTYPVKEETETTSPKAKNDRTYYQTNAEFELEFDINPDSCKPFGFCPGDRVMTPKGQATVIGVNSGKLWFHVDGDKGATHWGELKKEAFYKKEFYLIKSAS